LQVRPAEVVRLAAHNRKAIGRRYPGPCAVFYISDDGTDQAT
jgi:hypothetical protein